jgi:iron complex outermembrane receptor protein
LKSAYRIARGVVVLAALPFGHAGYAAEAAAPGPGNVEEIVVTGSYISGTPKDAALPVDVITADDLKLRGDPSALDMIRAMPYVGPTMGETNQFAGNQGTIGIGNINLRGLGGQRTLTLMNGRRTTYTPAEGPVGVDTNLLPMEAVGRVEILKDGAAAIYGSDAIAGVVNFITRRDLDGFDIGSNFLLSLARQTRGELKTTDRDWAFPGYLKNTAGWSTFSTPGTFRRLDAGGLPIAGSTVVDSNCTALGGFASPGTCRFSYIPFDNIVEKTERQQAYAEINTKLGETSELHLEGLYADTNLPDYRTSPGYPPTSGPNGPGGGQFIVPNTGPTPFSNNPGALAALQQAGISAADIAATGGLNLLAWRPLGWGGAPQVYGGNGGSEIPLEYTMGRVAASVKGEHGYRRADQPPAERVGRIGWAQLQRYRIRPRRLDVPGLQSVLQRNTE